MKFQKFILTSHGDLRLGLVNMHKDLLLPGEYCLGGGFYQFDYVAMRIILDRESMDYGRPRWSRVETLYVGREYEGMSLVYKPSSTEEVALSDILTIKYV
ncbi:MAG: hypothetical protein J6X81_02570 [Muribaculaceae bacterium]|nr:hypothetical protein [Muribaculaceae bacterium]